MSKYLQSAFYFIFFIFLFSSCSIKEEMWLEEDGSGKVVYSMDMGKAMGMMSMMMGEEGAEGSGGGPADLFKDFPDGETEVDSMVNILEIMPDSVRRNMDNPEVLEHMNMIIRGNKDKQEITMGISADFESFSELDLMFQKMGEIKEAGGSQDPMAMLSGGFGDQGFAENYSINRKQFVRKEMQNNDAGDMGLGGEDMDMDEMAGMAEMFGEMEMISVYHFPYNVKSVEGVDAVIDGKTVTIKQDLMEMYKQETFPELKVNFKRKKFLGIF